MALTNMRVPTTVQLREVSFLLDVVHVQIAYRVLAQDGAVMYDNRIERDVSGIAGILDYTIGQLRTWSQGQAEADAQTQYGAA